MKKNPQDTAVDAALNANPTLSGEKTDHCVFSRSATGWESFATARKTLMFRTLTLAQARAVCCAWNDHRTTTQVKRGTRWEFTTLASF